MSKSKKKPRETNVVCEYASKSGRTCTHPRCIRGCGKECSRIIEHVIGYRKYTGKEVWFHK